MVENQFIKRVLVRKNTANSAPEIIYETADNKLIEHKGMELLPMSGYMISDIYEELSNHVLIDLLVSIHNESVLDVEFNSNSEYALYTVSYVNTEGCIVEKR